MLKKNSPKKTTKKKAYATLLLLLVVYSNSLLESIILGKKHYLLTKYVNNANDDYFFNGASFLSTKKEYFPSLEWLDNRIRKIQIGDQPYYISKRVDILRVLTAKDEAFTFFGLDRWYLEDYYSWGDDDPRNGLKGVTVAVLDTGLNYRDWIDLENNVPHIHIKAYVTAYDRYAVKNHWSGSAVKSLLKSSWGTTYHPMLLLTGSCRETKCLL